MTKECARSLDPLQKKILVCLVCAGEVDLVEEGKAGNEANPARIGGA